MKVIRTVTLEFIPLECEVTDLLAGHYVVIMEDGRRGYMQIHDIRNGRTAVVNGHFHYDHSPVTHYAVWQE